MVTNLLREIFARPAVTTGVLADAVAPPPKGGLREAADRGGEFAPGGGRVPGKGGAEGGGGGEEQPYWKNGPRGPGGASDLDTRLRVNGDSAARPDVDFFHSPARLRAEDIMGGVLKEVTGDAVVRYTFNGHGGLTWAYDAEGNALAVLHKDGEKWRVANPHTGRAVRLSLWGDRERMAARVRKVMRGPVGESAPPPKGGLREGADRGGEFAPGGGRVPGKGGAEGGGGRVSGKGGGKGGGKGVVHKAVNVATYWNAELKGRYPAVTFADGAVLRFREKYTLRAALRAAPGLRAEHPEWLTPPPAHESAPPAAGGLREAADRGGEFAPGGGRVPGKGGAEGGGEAGGGPVSRTPEWRRRGFSDDRPDHPSFHDPRRLEVERQAAELLGAGARDFFFVPHALQTYITKPNSHSRAMIGVALRAGKVVVTSGDVGDSRQFALAPDAPPDRVRYALLRVARKPVPAELRAKYGRKARESAPPAAGGLREPEPHGGQGSGVRGQQEGGGP